MSQQEYESFLNIEWKPNPARGCYKFLSLLYNRIHAYDKKDCADNKDYAFFGK